MQGRGLVFDPQGGCIPPPCPCVEGGKEDFLTGTFDVSSNTQLRYFRIFLTKKKKNIAGMKYYEDGPAAGQESKLPENV